MAQQSLLKWSLAASLLLAGAGVGYYYAVYLPHRDAALAEAKRLAQERAEAERRAARERQLAQQEAADERRAAAQAAAAARYQTCVTDAGTAHDTAWAAECKRVAGKSAQDRADCLAKLSQTYCDAAYRTASTDASPNCALPPVIATGLDAELTRAKNLCARARDAAGQ